MCTSEETSKTSFVSCDENNLKKLDRESEERIYLLLRDYLYTDHISISNTLQREEI